MDKAIIKFNGGKLALLCSTCSKILKTGKDFTEEEMKYTKGEIEYIPPMYCENCDNLLLKGAD